MSSRCSSKYFLSSGSHSVVRAAERFRLRSLLVLLVMWISLSFIALAQQATIVGTVTDQSGAALPAVKITITNTESSAFKTIQTNDAGQYVVPDRKSTRLNSSHI